MERYGIIQLSDLQFGAKHRFGSSSNISKYISYDINELSEKYSFIPMYLLITGDISETSNKGEYDEAIREICLIREAASIDRDSVLLVPGNHDVNWALSEMAEDIGDNYLKFTVYNNFSRTLTNNRLYINNDVYTKVIDNRLGIEFLLINSCEKEDKNNHYGYVDPEKLLRSIKAEQKSTERYLKICILHHRLDSTAQDSREAIINAKEIESIIFNNGYNIVLTGHVHQTMTHKVTKENKSVVFSGTGSSGVNQSQREDGTQNQYCIHVIDTHSKNLETYWRAFNPAKRTKFGIGGWTEDNSVETNPELYYLSIINGLSTIKENIVCDTTLMCKLNIKSNPFTYSNAEKISPQMILDLFVSSKARHQNAMELSGDAIIRGRRGSGKTMLLRYLKISGDIKFEEAITSKNIAESLPVFINLSRIHRSEWGNNIDTIVDTADKLIYDSVIDAIEGKVKVVHSESFKSAVFKMKQRLGTLKDQEGSLVSKLGIAIRDCLSSYFKHVLLLIDEIVPVFPKDFFVYKEDGFLRWMNSIRNSGPYYTRVAIYPNSISDVLNEDRFGTIINLEYEVRREEDYYAFRKYCIEIVNRYLKSVAIDEKNSTTISEIINIAENSSDDALEQLIYAADGSSRRFLSFMDKCLNHLKSNTDKTILDKDKVFNVIKEFSSNLLSGYSKSEQELAISIAKVCKKQVTFRYRLPGLSGALNSLFAAREELNIVKVAEVGSGKRGTTYEFTYPYCILMDIQTHNIKETRKVCSSRDHINGEWITQVTTIQKEQLDIFNTRDRIIGKIAEIGGGLILIISDDDKEYISEELQDSFEVGDEVSFVASDTIAYDIVLHQNEWDYSWLSKPNA